MKRFFVPEVVQTSNMDCGPASLKCLLEGFGIPISYGRLREACQTGLDGTSIDTMEAVANQLGLEAEQVLLPLDHLFLPEAKALPALVVVMLPNGMTHFVVVWRRHGKFLQIMDPAVGRRWVKLNSFEKEIYAHAMPVGAADWLEFAHSDSFLNVLRARLRHLGLGRADVRKLLERALEADGWRELALLDAAVRLVQALIASRAVRTGGQVMKLLTRFLEKPELIARQYWSASPSGNEEDGAEQVLMRGAVLVRANGHRPVKNKEELGRELSAALEEKPVQPGRELAKALWHSGPLGSFLLLAALTVAAAGTIIETMLLRGLLDVTQELGLAGQRMGAIASVILFSLALLFLEIPTFSVGGRLGRQIENRLRIRFLEKIPKLGDRYFQSRLTSDMAERSHATKRLRHLPDQLRQVLRAISELCFTAAAITWLEPSTGALVWLIVAVILLPAFTSQSVLAERDLRARSHAAGLTRFYLDAMLGLLAIRVHGGERSVRREHEKLLGEWAQAALGLQKLVVNVEAVQLVLTFGLVGALLLIHPFTGSGIGRTLLLLYWALNLPVLGQEIGSLSRQYPYYRNLTLRLLDPLGAPEEETQVSVSSVEPLGVAPSIEFRDVSVQVSGHTILEEISVCINSGSHVAVVGPSGAGKSSFVGLLLGWLKASAGEILIDGEPLNPEQVRLSCAWVDPAVQLWNRPLLTNIAYGAEDHVSGVGDAIDTALLRSVLETLPEGMQTRLGEGGALVSGGEGQRVRFARALLRPDVRLVILDEPFRGLDREKRRELLRRARATWRNATVVCITHDLAETQEFDQVLVIERGRISDNGAPEELSSNRGSRYNQLLSAEEETRSGLWGGPVWRRIRVHSGRVIEEHSGVDTRHRQGSEVA